MMRTRRPSLLLLLLCVAWHAGPQLTVLAGDRSETRSADWWSLRELVRPSPPGVKDSSWVRTPLDAFILATLEAQRTAAQPRGRSPHADPSPLVRPDRPAADARGNRCVRRGSQSRCLRAAGRSAAGLAALRRALGPALARRGALRRHARLRQGQAPRPRLALSRLRHRRLQRRPAVTAGSSASRFAGDVLWPGDPNGVRSRPASSPPGRGTSSATSSCAKGRSTS